jgi:gliding motility-associated protein GldM
MAGGKETPRQKMIGMMYLVLTALLAMNISKDVLNAFIQINRGLVKNSANSEVRADATLGLLDNWSDKEKARPFQDKAHEMVEKADVLRRYIVELKAHVLDCSVNGTSDGSGFKDFIYPDDYPEVEKRGESWDIGDKEKVSKPDENQNTTGMLIGDAPDDPKTGPWSAAELREKLTAFSKECQELSVVDLKGNNHVLAEKSPEAKALIENTFSFAAVPNLEKGEKDQPWETSLFYHSPLAAVIAHLSKIESDVILVKNTVLNYLASQINASDLKFSDVTVAVVPKQSYILKGDSFVAEIYLAAYNKASKTKVYMGGEVGDGAKPELFDYAGREAIVSGSDGKCKFKINESALGSHSHKGVIVYQDAEGQDKAIPFIIPAFTVGEIGLVVSAAKMNVFYRGLANPVEVSVPGVDPSQLQVSASGGSLSSRGGGNYDFTPPADGGPGDAQINVTATINGKSVNMGSKPFKVKPLPRPIAKFAGVTSESSTVSQGCRSSSFIEAFMPEDFVFTGIQVNIVSFEMEISGPGKEKSERCSGSSLSAGLRGALAKVTSGDQIIIKNILYTTNGTGAKPLGSMALTVK